MEMVETAGERKKDEILQSSRCPAGIYFFSLPPVEEEFLVGRCFGVRTTRKRFVES